MGNKKIKCVVLTIMIVVAFVFTFSSVKPNTANAASKVRLVDVSSHNGYIDWTKVKKSGISAAILRAGYGKNTVDAQFRRNATNANKVGIPIGVYWFSYAYTVNQAKQEAKKCIETIKQYKITLPVFFDWEYDSMRYAKQNGVRPGKQLITDMNKAFCEEITKAGYKAGVYYNRDYKNNYMYVNQLKKYTQWYAYYNKNLDDYSCDIWQYNEGTGVSGINSSRVDLNYLINNDLLKDTTSTTKSKTTTTKKSTATSTFKSYKVKIKPYELNVRTGQGTKYAIINQVKQGQTVTISKEKNGWGYVSAKKGWINVSSKYVTKVTTTKKATTVKKTTTTKKTTVKYYKKVNEKYSIVNALVKAGVKSPTFKVRKQIAAKNGIKNYKGTASQNVKMLKLITKGKLVK